MKRKTGKKFIWFIAACMILTVFPMTALASGNAPAVVSGQETQTGTAVPASKDTAVAAVPYTADMSGWFEDAELDTLSYHVVSAEDASSNDVYSDVAIVDSVVTYIPAAAQASQDVTIIVKANDGTVDSTANVTIIVAVGSVPSDSTNEPDRKSADYTLAIGDQAAGGAGYHRQVTITDVHDSGLNGKYLVIQYTSGTGENAKVSVVITELNDSSTTVGVSYQAAETAVAAWLTSGMPDLTGENLGVTVFASANSN